MFKSTLDLSFLDLHLHMDDKSYFSGENIHLHRRGQLLAPPFSFALKDGGILLICGKNGSGKSSLLRLLAGLLLMVEGTFFWQGQKISTQSSAHRQKVAYLGHKVAVESHLTVLEQLQKGVLLYRSKTQPSLIQEKLENFDLEKLSHVPLQFLSQGQQQRVALCRVILSGRPLWLLDEPTSNLDEAAQKTLYCEIKSHIQKGGLVALASHEGVPLPVEQVVRL